jgi:hypothetical protein
LLFAVALDESLVCRTLTRETRIDRAPKSGYFARTFKRRTRLRGTSTRFTSFRGVYLHAQGRASVFLSHAVCHCCFSFDTWSLRRGLRPNRGVWPRGWRCASLLLSATAVCAAAVGLSAGSRAGSGIAKTAGSSRPKTGRASNHCDAIATAAWSSDNAIIAEKDCHALARTAWCLREIGGSRKTTDYYSP